MKIVDGIPVGATKVNPGRIHVGVNIVADYIPIFLLKYKKFFLESSRCVA
jgi:hypothetical protein